MMIPTSDQQLLWDYLDHQLKPETRLALEVRLAGEPLLAEELQRYRAVHDRLAFDSFAAPLPENFEAKVLAKIPQKLQKSRYAAISGRYLNVFMIVTGILTGIVYWLQLHNYTPLNTHFTAFPENQVILLSMLCLNGFILLILADRFLQYRRSTYAA